MRSAALVGALVLFTVAPAAATTIVAFEGVKIAFEGDSFNQASAQTVAGEFRFEETEAALASNVPTGMAAIYTYAVPISYGFALRDSDGAPVFTLGFVQSADAGGLQLLDSLSGLARDQSRLSGFFPLASLSAVLSLTAPSDLFFEDAGVDFGGADFDFHVGLGLADLADAAFQINIPGETVFFSLTSLNVTRSGAGDLPVAAAPLPAGLLLLAAALGALGLLARRRRAASG